MLTIVFWRDKDMSSDVAVRPDGKISLPLLNDVQAAGLTPEQLRVQLTEAAAKFIEEPTVTVVVKAINSRKVFITGQVGKPGPYPLTGADDRAAADRDGRRPARVRRREEHPDHADRERQAGELPVQLQGRHARART